MKIEKKRRDVVITAACFFYMPMKMYPDAYQRPVHFLIVENFNFTLQKT